MKTGADSSDARPSLSRRDLFRTAGLSAGGVILLGLPPFLSCVVWPVEAEIKNPSFIQTNTVLEIEGQFAGFLTARGGRQGPKQRQGHDRQPGDPGELPGKVFFADETVMIVSSHRHHKEWPQRCEKKAGGRFSTAWQVRFSHRRGCGTRIENEDRSSTIP